ncbi:hypothetical protein [Streptomyces sp. NPDC051000]|uniref:hypothetical protein n=1 Tax=unclassified Streptomyces TaxID=2593676 RepID=UPI0033C2245D
MGAIRSSATALLSAGATGAALALGALGAPAATAAEAAPITSFGFALSPSTVAPGGQTVLSVSGCGSAFATASSGVFDTVSIARGQTVRVTVDRDARVGALYSVSFTCNGETGSADLTIAGGTARPTTSSTVDVRRTPLPIPPPPPAVTPTRAPTPPPAVAPVRTAGVAPTRSVSRPASSAGLGVRGGVGGSVAGMDPVELGVGAALVLAGVAGTTYALRRRRSARGH